MMPSDFQPPLFFLKSTFLIFIMTFIDLIQVLGLSVGLHSLICIHFGFILAPLGAPQIPPKITHGALWLLFGALKFRLGDPGEFFDLF